MTNDDQVIKTFTFALSDKEKASYAHKAAKNEIAIEKLEEERKAINAEIKNHRESRHELLKAIETGEEERSVPCEVIKDFDNDEVQYVFEGKVIDSRPMEDSDRQMNLKKPAKKKAHKRRSGKKSEQEPVLEAVH